MKLKNVKNTLLRVLPMILVTSCGSKGPSYSTAKLNLLADDEKKEPKATEQNEKYTAISNFSFDEEVATKFTQLVAKVIEAESDKKNPPTEKDRKELAGKFTDVISDVAEGLTKELTKNGLIDKSIEE